MGDPVRWTGEAEEVISGDITAAAAYLSLQAEQWLPVSLLGS